MQELVLPGLGDLGPGLPAPSSPGARTSQLTDSSPLGQAMLAGELAQHSTTWSLGGFPVFEGLSWRRASREVANEGL